MSALTPYAVTPERRTDSKPFRRRLVRKNGFGSCRRKLLQNYFRQSFESSPESRGSQTSGVLLVLFVQAKRINPYSLAGRFEVLQSSNQRTKPKFRTNKIKSFRRPAAAFPCCSHNIFRRPAAAIFLLFVGHKK